MGGCVLGRGRGSGQRFGFFFLHFFLHFFLLFLNQAGGHFRNPLAPGSLVRPLARTTGKRPVAP